jgi:hypothetical protein
MHVEGQRHQEFRDLILELVLLFKPDTYCEIGIKKGYVFNHIAPHVKRAIAVDKAPFRGIYKKSNAIHFQEDSIDFAIKWASQKYPRIDFLFIDADHDCRQVIADFVAMEIYVPVHSGLILLHDTYPINKSLTQAGFCGTAWKAAKTIKEGYPEIEIVTLPGPRAGLSIIRKAPTHGWMDK